MASRALKLLAVAAVFFVGTVVVFQSGVFTPPLAPSDYQNATLTLSDANGTELSTVEVRIADTERKRYVGLSETDSLPDGDGMLFAHETAGPHAYVMRDMAFSLDIVFVADNGTVTAIHHADPEDPGVGESLTRYRGRGRYVLEVPRGYANRTGLDVGDRVVIPPAVG